MKPLAIQTVLLGFSLAALPALAQPDQPSSPLPEWQEPLTGMQFVTLPAGCFQMGNPDALRPERDRQLLDAGYSTPRYADEAPVHQVCLDAFLLGRFEVTNEQWQLLMPPPKEAEAASTPVAGISRQQAELFAERLSQQSPAGYRYRLPTEAEWEYACRGGLKEEPPAYFDRDRQEQAWYSYSEHRPSHTNQVGKLDANDWGLHDMLGNVWELTADSYSASAYQEHEFRNPQRVDANTEAVIRGGGFRSYYKDVRCSSRSSYPPALGLEQIGLRLVRSLTR